MRHGNMGKSGGGETSGSGANALRGQDKQQGGRTKVNGSGPGPERKADMKGALDGKPSDGLSAAISSLKAHGDIPHGNTSGKKC